MLTILLSVAVISLSGVMMPGPMFAATVAKSYRSPWAGALVSVGHAVVEVPIILLIYFGFARFFESTVLQLVLSLLGGGMIVWLGIGMFRSRREIVHRGQDVRYGAVTAGIIMSAFNPFFLLWWATTGLMLVMRVVDYGPGMLVPFTLVHWGCDLVWLTFVSVLIYRTRTLWGRRFQEGLFVLTSLALLYFGGWFIFSGIQRVLPAS